MISFNTYCTFEIFFYYLEIQETSNIVSCNNYTLIVHMNEVCYNTQFHVLKSLINVNNMHAQVFDEVVSVIKH